MKNIVTMKKYTKEEKEKAIKYIEGSLIKPEMLTFPYYKTSVN